MTRKILRLLCSAMVCTGPWLPVHAAEPDQALPAPTPASESKGTMKEAMGQLPRRLAGFLAGVVIGTPIAIVRRSAAETVSATHDIVGDSTNPLFVLPAGALSLPFGVLGGTIEGAYLGPLNAWVNSGDEPFGKDSFSLGEMK